MLRTYLQILLRIPNQAKHRTKEDFKSGLLWLPRANGTELDEGCVFD